MAYHTGREKRYPAYEIDCVVNFWDLVAYTGMDDEELFYSLFPYADFEDCEGRWMLIDAYTVQFCQEGEDSDEVMQMWQEVCRLVEDGGHRFYDKVMIVF